jgi:hypothetical protein
MDTLRFYAQSNIYDNYIVYIQKIMDKYAYFFSILLPMKLNTKCTMSDISIVMMREVEITAQSKNACFIRATKYVTENTKKKILFIVFSTISKDIANQRKMAYQLQIPNSSIVYLDFEDWFPVNTDDYYNRHYKQLHLLDEIINSFITGIMTDITMY